MNLNNINIQFDVGSLNFKVLNIHSGTFKNIIPKHSHSNKSFEIHYITSGHGALVLDDHSYNLKPNDLFTTGPHIRHQQIPHPENPMSEYCLLFEITSKPDINNTPFTPDSICNLFLETSFWLGQDQQNIKPLFDRIYYELTNQYLGYYLTVQSLFQLLIVSLVRNYETNFLPPQPIPSKNLDDNRLVIIEHSFLCDYRYITAPLLAERLGLSPRQMRRILQHYYQMSFNQKKLEARMSAAISLLESSSKDIEKIGFETGFSSLEHFSSAFKKYCGLPPSEYRKKYLSNH